MMRHLLMILTLALKFTFNAAFIRNILHSSGVKPTLNSLYSLAEPQQVVSSTTFSIPYVKDQKNRINQLIDPSNIRGIKFRYIAVATKEIALECKRLISTGAASFSTLASTLSLCEVAKHNGGESSWISSLDLERVPIESHIPIDVVNEAWYMSKGDLSVLQTSSKVDLENKSESVESLWYVVQLLDVDTKLTPAFIKRRQENYSALRGKKNMDDSNQEIDEKTYYIDTMGCQMNVADSERMESQMIDMGYIRSGNEDSANLVILNTCSIRDHAEQKVYSYIGPHASRKRKGEDVCIVVAGCVAQQEGEVLARRFPELDIVMGPQYANRLSDLLESVAEGNQVVATDPLYQMEDKLPPTRKSSIAAFVNVIYGCNERCTYCVVPNTRGVEQSRTKDAIVSECRDLAAQGYREVTLLGQNVDSWGRDFTPKQKFADLLAAVGEVSGIERVRFLTSHPKYMSERVIEVVAKNPKLMPCFNVPFQSGDNEVLKNMRRGYHRDRYLEIIRKIRSLVPDAAITTDVIVGFPGETEEQFQNTLRLMEEVKFEQVNTAAYSPRPNTPAADWDQQLSEEVKQDRLQRINRLGSEHALERSKRFVGRVMEVLVEDVNIKNPSQVVGRNPHSRLVYFEGKIRDLKGKIVPVEITEARGYSLTGRLVGEGR